MEYVEYEDPREVEDQHIADLIDISLSEFKEKQYRFQHDSHLNSPLISDSAHIIIKEPENIACFKHRQLRESIKKIGYDLSNIETQTTHYWGRCKDWLDSLKTSNTPNNFDAILEAAERVTINSACGWESSVCLDPLDRLKIKSLIYKDYCNLVKATRLKKLYTKIPINQKTVIRIGDEGYVIGQFFLLARRPGILAPIEFLTGVLDEYTKIFNARLFCILQDHYHPISIHRLTYLDRYINQGLQLREKHGEKFYKIMKNLENIVKGLIVDHDEPELKNQLLASVLADLSEVEPNFQYHPMFVQIKDLIMSGHVELALDIGGLSKIFGYPFINHQKGYEGLKNRTRECKFPDIELTQNMRVVFRKIFCKSFVRKEGKWPAMNFHGRRHPILHQAIREARQLTSHEENTIPDEDWLAFRFTKTLNPYYATDVEDVLNDKSVSEGLAMWPKMYCACGFKRNDQPKPKFPANTTSRLLMKYISSPTDVEGEAIIRKVATRAIPSDDYCAVLCAKECESNDVGRMFTKQTFDIRLYQVLTEENIARNIMKYLDFQSMTMSDLKTDQRVIAMSFFQSISSQTSKTLLVHDIDFEKWNSCFRYSLCAPIAKDCDDLLGWGDVINFSHEYFSKCMFFYNVETEAPMYDPKTNLPYEGRGCHCGQPGGCEGLRQKLWTIITALILFLSAQLSGTSIAIIGQGDNQLALQNINSRNRAYVKQMCELFLNVATIISEALGLKIKRTETITSGTLMSYSKNYYYKGVAICNPLKKCVAISGDLNTAYNSIFHRIATIFTGGESTAKQTLTPYSAFFLSQVHAGFQICEEFNPHLKFPLTSLQISAILSVPSTFGGFPIASYTGFCLRGIVDPLTDQLFYLMRMKLRDPELYNLVMNFTRRHAKVNVDLTKLLDDVYSLNLANPIVGDQYLAKFVSTYVKRTAQNPKLRKLIDSSGPDVDKRLKEYLLTARPLVPKVLKSLYRVTPSGHLENLCTKFDNTSSAIKLVSDLVGYETIGNYVTRQDTLQREHLLSYLVKPRSDTSISTMIDNATCSYRLAGALRFHTWGVPIVGVGMPNPAEQCSLIEWDLANTMLHDRSLYVRVSSEAYQDPQAMYTTRGPMKPFIGSDTREKILRSKTNKIDCEDPGFLRIRELAAWLSSEAGSNVRLFIINCLRARLPPELQVYIDFICIDEGFGYYGGSMTHRLRAPGVVSGSFLNQRYTPASHVSVSPSHSTVFARGSVDRPLFFQQLYISICQKLTLRAFDKNLRKSYAATFLCAGCFEPIPEDNFNFPAPPNDLFSYIDNGLAQFKLTLPPSLFCRPNIPPLRTIIPTYTLISIKLANIAAKEVDNFSSTLSTSYDLQSILCASRYSAHKYNMAEVESCDLEVLCQRICYASQSMTQFISFIAHKSEIILLNRERSILQQLPLYSLAISLLATQRLFELAILGNINNMVYTTTATNEGALGLLYKALYRTYIQRKWRMEMLTVPRNELTNMYHYRQILKYCLLCNIPRTLLPGFDNFSGLAKGETFVEELLCPWVQIIPTDDHITSLWRATKNRAPRVSYSKKFFKKLTALSPIVCFIQSPQAQKEKLNTITNLITAPQVPSNTWPSHHLFRRIGRETSAASKMHEIVSFLIKTGFLEDNLCGIICALADGSGTYLSTLLHIFPNTVGLFNTLVIDDDLPEGNVSSYLPPSIASDMCDLKSRVVRLTETTLGSTDLTQLATVEKLVKTISKLREAVKIVTMDAENATDPDLFFKIFQNLELLVPMCHRDCVWIMKWNFHSEGQYIRGIRFLNYRLKEYRFLKCRTSSLRTSELFIVFLAKDYHRGGGVSLLNIKALNNFANQLWTADKEIPKLYPLFLKMNLDIPPCLDLVSNDFDSIGVRKDSDEPIPDQITAQVFRLALNIIQSSYELISEKFSSMEQFLMGTSNRNYLITRKLRDLYLLCVLLSSREDATLEELMNRINFHLLTIDLYYPEGGEYVNFDPSGKIIYSNVVSISELLGDKIKSLVRMWAFMKSLPISSSANFTLDDPDLIKELYIEDALWSKFSPKVSHLHSSLFSELIEYENTLKTMDFDELHTTIKELLIHVHASMSTLQMSSKTNFATKIEGMSLAQYLSRYYQLDPNLVSERTRMRDILDFCEPGWRKQYKQTPE